MGKSTRQLGLVTLLFVLASVDRSVTSYIRLTRDGYQNVVVNIQTDTDFSNCQETLDKVKELIRNTSSSFGNALDRPAFFGNVTIIAPDWWANDATCRTLLTTTNTTRLPWVRSHRADIQITSDHPVFGWYPHSFQYGGCGVPGLPIQVPSSFIANGTDFAQGKRMAREWAHYRYGIFDEGGIPGDPRHPSGYLAFQTESPGTTQKANTCSNDRQPRGYWMENCSTVENSSCEFVPYTYNPGIVSSLMYGPQIESMEFFCTKYNHDDSVPSKQSYYCGRLSASEKIYQHQDFTSGVTPVNTSAEITFNVVQNPFTGYHVLFDMASFNNGTMFDIAKSSLMQFISFLQVPVLFSIDTYDETGWREFQLPINLDATTQKLLISNLSTALKWTRPGNLDTFESALSNAQLRAYDGQDVIVLTALKESGPNWSTWIQTYNEENINVHVIHFGASTSQPVPIVELARYGSVHFVPNVDNQLTSSYVWATNALQSLYIDTLRPYRVKIHEQTILKTGFPELNRNGTFYVDKPSSQLLGSIYYLSGSAISSLNFTLIRPDGERIAPNTLIPNTFYGWAVVSPDQQLLPSGVWRYEISFGLFSPDGAVRMDIWSEAPNSTQIQMKTWNNATENRPLDFTSYPIGLYAQLTQDAKPVAGANVIASVYADAGNGVSALIAEIPLLDRGKRDVTSGDGVYSGWLTNRSNTSLSYSVYYRAYGVANMAQVDNGVYGRPPTTGSVIPMSEPVPAAVQFNRFHYGPSFQLTKPSNGVDEIPPERVTDLRIVDYDYSDRKATLQWTAIKDNYGTGETITSYRVEEVVGSRNPQTKIYSVVDVNGLATLAVTVPSAVEGESVRYRVQGRDSFGNFAESSNSASLAGPAPPSRNLSLAAMWGLIGGAIALLLILLIIILICCCCPVAARRRKRQATKTVQQMFKSNSKKNDTAVSRYQPPVNSWQSPAMQQDDDLSPPDRRESTSTIDRPVQVEVRQKSADPGAASTRSSERIYFGQEDIERMRTGPRSATYSERGTEEMVKRAPSMDLQLATILRMNSSNLSIDQFGAEEGNVDARPVEVVNTTKIYARPYKPQTSTFKAANSRPPSRGINSQTNKPLSLSESNLYYTDVAMRPSVAQSTKSTPRHSYMSVYAERADVVPQPYSGQSSLANTLRAGMPNDDWQDSNSYIYTDPRFDNVQTSSFNPQLHPANQVGLPPALPSVPPPLLPRSFIPEDQRSSSNSSYTGNQMGRSSSKPSLVSAV